MRKFVMLTVLACSFSVPAFGGGSIVSGGIIRFGNLPPIYCRSIRGTVAVEVVLSRRADSGSIAINEDGLFDRNLIRAGVHSSADGAPGLWIVLPNSSVRLFLPQQRGESFYADLEIGGRVTKLLCGRS